MAQSAQLINDSYAVFTCNQCKQVVHVPMTKCIRLSENKLKLTCRCGQLNKVIVESRRSVRKPADISGIYKIATEDKNEKTGSMTIKNISWQGFKLKISGYGYGIKEHDVQCNRYDQEDHQCLFAHNHLKVGDQITIEFFLDDPKMSFISRSVNIKWVQDDQFGVELQHPEDFEPSIRFYLLGLKTP